MNFTVNGRFLVIMENNIQKSLRWICTALFPILCIGMIWFLQNFTKLDTSIQYIDWQTAVKIGQDDSLTELTIPYHLKQVKGFGLKQSFPQTANTVIWYLKRQE